MEKNQKVKENVSFDTSINDRFLEFFKKNDLNFSEVSRITGISDVTFGHIKSYRNLPSISTLLTMRDAFKNKKLEQQFSVEYILLNKKEFDIAVVMLELERVQKELASTKIELGEAKEERSSLIKALGKDESEANSLLVDTEEGVRMMNLTLYAISGLALSERLN